MISMKYNTKYHIAQNPLWEKRKCEIESLFIRHKKHWILIISDPKCLKTCNILHENLLVVNGDNKSKQIYKTI